MKVYAFTCHTAVNGEFLCAETEVFPSRWLAKDAFFRWRADEIDFAARDGWKIGTDTGDRFEASKEGAYCTDHTEGFIKEFDIP